MKHKDANAVVRIDNSNEVLQLEVTIGYGQTATTNTQLDFSPLHIKERDSYVKPVGVCSSLNGSLLEIATLVTDTNKATNMTSVEVKLFTPTKVYYDTTSSDLVDASESEIYNYTLTLLHK
jgi:hypothetical protein